MKAKLVSESIEELNEGKFGRGLAGAALGTALAFGSPQMAQAEPFTPTEQIQKQGHETETISEGKFGLLSGELMKITSGDDVTYYLYFHFQNKKYSHITDIGSIMFGSKEEVDKFVKDFQYLLPKMGSNSSIRQGHLQYYDFAKKSIYVNDGKKYTTINAKNAQKLISWIESLDLSVLR